MRGSLDIGTLMQNQLFALGCEGKQEGQKGKKGKISGFFAIFVLFVIFASTYYSLLAPIINIWIPASRD
jgi:hypothetical protein